MEFCRSNYEEAEIIIVGLEEEETVERKGTRLAPSAIMEAFKWIEYYSPATDKDLLHMKIYNANNIKKEKLSNLLFSKQKKFIFIGGEHSLTFFILKELISLYEDIILISYDAHMDLRNYYQGKFISYATVMRRCSELLNKNNLYLVGMRSYTKEELLFAEKHTTFIKDVSKIKFFLDDFKNKPIYLSIDMDILDPGYAPGVSAPEPAGINFNTLIDSLYSLKNLNIVCVDVVEVSPPYDVGDITAITAAKLIREIILGLL